MNPFISICIPSYNRPLELVRLLKSINPLCKNDIEVVICEDNSPKRADIIKSVENFKENSNLRISLNLNTKNLGYDANLRELVNVAQGEFIIFMGDDDVFDFDNLPKFIEFLRVNSDLGYVLKTHSFIHANGSKEFFRYYSEDTFFPPGVDSYQALFRKSVLISGFCIKRAYALPFQTDQFDGSLLYQLYLLAEVTLLYPSAYCSIPLTIQDESLRGVPLFGSSESEKELYTPGVITVDNSINFMLKYFEVTKFIDKKHKINSTNYTKLSFSKYSYPVISIQRDKGRKIFIDYCKRLESLIQINQSFYYYIYYYSLLIFNRRFCDNTIILLKRIIGKTPQL